MESSSSFAMSRPLRVVRLNAQLIIASIEQALVGQMNFTLFDDLARASRVSNRLCPDSEVSFTVDVH